MKNIFEKIPSDLSSEVFESLIDSESIKIERIVSKGQSSPKEGWYDQVNNEWVIILKGHAVVLFDCGKDFHLAEGDFLNMKSHQKHKITLTYPVRETVSLAIHY